MERYYKILKLTPGATIAEIKKAYRQQVKFWHPDRFPRESARLQKKAHDMLKEINEAYKKVELFEKSRTRERTLKKGSERREEAKTGMRRPEPSPPPPRRSTSPSASGVGDSTSAKSSPASAGKSPPEPSSVPRTIFKDGAHIFPNGDRYIGEIKNGRFHGKGTYIFGRGDKYAGEFVDGRPHGFGTFYYSNGDRYEGAFLEDQMTGQGTYTHANGDQYAGGFRNGVPHGRGTYLAANGKRLAGMWDNGEFLG
ncbi:MAG: DnaJ domain-containing protein [Nitrospinae bacterium]|nr:DnaJ domain-containing protein [Nitrospinota bacterium]